MHVSNYHVDVTPGKIHSLKEILSLPEMSAEQVQVQYMCLRLILKVHSSKELAGCTVAKPAEIFPCYIPELQK